MAIISKGAYVLNGYLELYPPVSNTESYTYSVGIYFRGEYFSQLKIYQADYEDWGDEITVCQVFLVDGSKQITLAQSGSSSSTARINYDNEVIEFLEDVNNVFYNQNGFTRKYYSLNQGSISRLNVNTVRIDNYPYYYSEARKQNVAISNNNLRLVLKQNTNLQLSVSSENITVYHDALGEYYLDAYSDGFSGEGIASNEVSITKYTLSTPTLSANKAHLTWGSVSNAAKYYVYKDGVKITETTELSYDATGVGSYQVQAISSSGWYNNSGLSAAQNIGADAFFQAILDAVIAGKATFDGITITGVIFKEEA